MKTILRNLFYTLKRFRTASVLNLLGLSTAFAAFMLIMMKASYEYNFDTCYPDSDRLKAQFISNMSHEIRTPLNAIVGFSQLIADATSKEEQEEYQRIVMLNNNLLLTLIEDVLNLSVLDSGKMTFNNTVFNLSEMFGDLAIQMKDKVKLPGREVHLRSPASRKCRSRPDRERLTQIVTNLITNAAKFTRQGYIKMGYALKDSGVEIYVKDTGMGIEERI